MGTVITVTSGKGGTGKTTTVAAFGSCLAALGHRTLCLDCDTGLRNLDLALGMSDFTVTDFSDILNRYIHLGEACHEHPQIPGLFFLSAPQLDGDKHIDAAQMAALVAEIKESFDFCLIDSPAGVAEGFRLALTGTDMALLVTNGEISSTRDGQRVVEELKTRGIVDVRLILNRVSPRRFKQILLTIDHVIDTVGARLIGLVPEDGTVFYAWNTETPLVLCQDKSAAHSFLQITRRLLGENLPFRKN